MIGWALIFAAFTLLMASWQECFDIGCDRFIRIEDPDNWKDRESEWCIAQVEFASDFADDCNDDDEYDDEEEEDCIHPDSTQGSDGAYRCDECGKITADISDSDFAAQNGDNFSSSDFQGW